MRENMLKKRDIVEKNTMSKNSKGITLIALVITVIVLLILAGVSISAITGNESTMEKAKQARTANEQGGEEDAIKLAVVSAMSQNTTTYGMVEEKYLTPELAKIGATATSSGSDFIVTVTASGRQYTVTKAGIVTLRSGARFSTNTIEFGENADNSTVTLNVIPEDGATISSVEWGTVSGSSIIFTPGNTSATVALGTPDSTLAKTGITITATATTSDGIQHPLSCKVTYKENTITTINVKTNSITVSKDGTTTIEVEGLGTLGSEISLTGSEGITYTSNAPSKATVSTDGTTFGESATSTSTNPFTATVKGVALGETTITVSCTGKTVTYNGGASSIGVTVEKYYITKDYSWEQLSEIAKLISDKSGAGTDQISSASESASVIYNSKQVTLNVGDEAKLKYNGNDKIVRIVGFNHDDLADTKAYVGPTGEGTNTKAGITFEFVDCLGTGQMNNSNTNSGGWNSCAMRTSLENDRLPNLSNKDYIKSVKKYCLAQYNSSSAAQNDGDKLWLFSTAELWGSKQYANEVEGSQYKQYAKGQSKVKNNGSSAATWWLRSPSSFNYTGFCIVGIGGGCNFNDAKGTLGVAPGFSI